VKLSNWLLNYDERFLEIVKDEYKRKDYLNQLYSFRTACFTFLCIFAIMTFVGIAFDKAWSIGLGAILFTTQGISYLDTDSKIRTIRLYELSTEK